MVWQQTTHIKYNGRIVLLLNLLRSCAQRKICIIFINDKFTKYTIQKYIIYFIWIEISYCATFCCLRT